ncbi:MAG: hypothetical protein IKN04_09040 [Clostridia bacterium]|nr:hypothetical protein [Clostridia bacterium]
MGKLIVTRRYVEERRLELSIEDLALRNKRLREKANGELKPSLLPWHHTFVKRLDQCPCCKAHPYIRALWNPEEGYEYKILCPNSCRTINCGDWYHQLSRAGLDWNYRAQEAAGWPHKHCPHWKGLSR